VYSGGELTDALIRLATNLNPGPAWPKYSPDARQILTLQDGLFPQVVTTDSYRQAGTDALQNLNLKYPQ
jgi:hypothetical protein